MRAGGGAVWVTLHGALVREGDGTPSHVLLQVQDITERRRLEARLRTRRRSRPAPPGC